MKTPGIDWQLLHKVSEPGCWRDPCSLCAHVLVPLINLVLVRGIIIRIEEMGPG